MASSMVAENPVVVMTCPARTQSTDERIREKKNIDFWMSRGPDRGVCSYCQSLAPDEFIAWCERAAEPDSRVIIDTSDTAGKLYIYRRGITSPQLGAIKFYSYHFDETSDEAERLMRMRVIGTAIERSVPRKKIVSPVKPKE